MSKKASKKSSTATRASEHDGGEIQIQKSPAEFFAENQAIAGFDNLGKSLYTTIRELIENSLDACESVHELPSISITIQEYNQSEFNTLTTNDVRLDTTSTTQQNSKQDEYQSPNRRVHDQIDTKLFEKKGARKRTSIANVVNLDDQNIPSKSDENHAASGDEPKAKKVKTSTKTEPNAKPNQYFLITVTDNGCGMEHMAIPDMFARVLSGSKYGVRQTRGKFGLGAKMALIWSKKSTGHPIHILTAHQQHGSTTSSIHVSDSETQRTAPSHISSCILDIDIYRNQPRILEHTKTENTIGLIGTTVRVLIAGNWTTYKSRILQYLQQLAIITPYAALSLTYTESTGKRDTNLFYHRRSEQMPDTPATVKHHPSSVNNIIIQQLIQHTKTKNLVSFLTQELQAISVPLAKRLVAELSLSVQLTEDMKPSKVTDKQITRLVQLFHQVQLFRPPDGSCLSPLGEYNLNLGIHKVLEPDYVATTRDKVSVYEGHPFVIEAAVSLGGNNTKEGVTVYRFANRIPLLFEGGADVATRVALTKIKWSNYKIDYKRDKVGVFVSIVSTKIPFKGTSKEYIGDDATEIHQSVKRALQACCQQLRSHLMKRNALKEAKTRRSKLVRYVPDISRSLYGLLDGMRQRRTENNEELQRLRTIDEGVVEFPTKRLRLDSNVASRMIQMLNKNQITEVVIHTSLMESIETEVATSADVTATNDDTNVAGNTAVASTAAAVPLYIVPLYNLDDPIHDVCHPLFTFRPIVPLVKLAIHE